MAGLDAARALLSLEPSARIVVLTGSPSAATVREARDLGASGRRRPLTFSDGADASV
jgi:DNA-binding NarL/FixJ family response regulator